ncbi:AAEL007195-PA [Aedes aegypti]|uniref:AAEL007195-PA n=1 Tax=Aedes aegypti TaxID=7159 RepID=Q173C9_AEDAE|nr:AAEL007195-PA [Aedes aegypti]
MGGEGFQVIGTRWALLAIPVDNVGSQALILQTNAKASNISKFEALLPSSIPAGSFAKKPEHPNPGGKSHSVNSFSGTLSSRYSTVPAVSVRHHKQRYPNPVETSLPPTAPSMPSSGLSETSFSDNKSQRIDNPFEIPGHSNPGATTLWTEAAKQSLTTTSTNSSGIDGDAEQHLPVTPSTGTKVGGVRSVGLKSTSTPPLPPVLAASLTVRDKSGLERDPKPVNHHFSSSSSILSNAKGSSSTLSGGSEGEPSSSKSRSKVNFNILYESSGRARLSGVEEPSEEAEGGVTRNNEPELSVSKQQSGSEDEDEYDYGDGRGDNYEDDKIINPAALDNFYDKSLNGGGGSLLGGSRFGHTATTKADYNDEDEYSNEGDDIDEDSYGEGGDILPVDGAFESFGKIGGETEVKSDSSLPYFLVEPQSTHVIRNKPAILKCKAANALQVHFKCSGSNKPPPSVEESHVDPHSGVHYQEVTATISRDLVYEYFGKAPFKCECHAWSPRGKTISQPASIVVAYLKKNFVLPAPKLRAEAGTKLEIKCTAPKGYPKPQIMWLKNNFSLTGSSPLLTFSSEGNILISAVKLQDIGNYTCVAENIAGKRTSEPIELIVYVNGGWSQWSAWLECRCPGKPAQGKKRTRTCSDPIPLYGGLPCVGPNQQKTLDCDTCPEDTQIITPNGFEDNTFGK